MIRAHRHIIIRATVFNPPQSEMELSEWCKEVINKVGMKVIGGPLTVYSDMEGNKGFTATAILDFSHLAIHTWDEDNPALIEFDLFSCKEFDPQIVVDMLDRFKLNSFYEIMIDRDGQKITSTPEKKIIQ